MKETVVIFGGGISGLTVAHELVEKGYHVKLFEKSNILGGMAKSRREQNGVPSEHSWRGYAPFYHNFFDIVKRIPISQNKTVYDNLSLPIDFHLLRDKVSTYKPKLNITDYIIVLYYGLKYLCSEDRRQDYYKTKLVPMLKNKLSEDGFDFLIEFLVGPGLGMEKKDVSYAHFFKVPILQTIGSGKYKHVHQNDNDSNYIHLGSGSWHVMNQPTNEAWFDPWKDYLISKGVEIYLNTELTHINYIDNNITSCTIESSVNKSINQKQIVGNNYVLCINPFEAERIFKGSNMISLYKQHGLLNKNTVSNQISFRIGLNKNIIYPIKNIAFVMPNSEFNITWYPQEEYWANSQLGNTESIKSLWSGTIIVAYSKGKLYNKTAIELNKQELINEIIYQILRSKSLQKLIYENNQFYISKNDIIYTEIWYEWENNGGTLLQNPQKWVNNIYNQEFRPAQITNFHNLYLGGAHTKTSVDIWSMEGAIESGKEIAKLITDSTKITQYIHNDPIFFQLFKSIDNISYVFKLPNIVDIILLIVILYLYNIMEK